MGLGKNSEKKAIDETLKIISEFPDTVTEKELIRAKEQTVASFVMSLESVSSLASRNGRNVLLYNKIISEEDVIEKIRAVTLEDLKATAREILDISKISVCAAGKVASEKAYKEMTDIH